MHSSPAAMVPSCAIALLMLVSLQAAATEPSQSAINKRALTGCMTKRMSADKTLSYNAALRACKDLIQAPKDALAANGPIDPGKSH
jgi:hypothetical protein